MPNPMQLTFASSTSIEGRTMNGIAHVFGERALAFGIYEEFAPGSFNAALKTSDVRALWEHDRGRLLGRTSSGTLRVWSGQDGGKPVLRYSIELPNTSYANDLRELVARGDLNQSSFGVVPGEFTWSTAPDGVEVRTHTRVAELMDVSPVAMPAFDGTRVEVHSRQPAESIGSQLVRARFRVLQGEPR